MESHVDPCVKTTNIYRMMRWCDKTLSNARHCSERATKVSFSLNEKNEKKYFICACNTKRFYCDSHILTAEQHYMACKYWNRCTICGSTEHILSWFDDPNGVQPRQFCFCCIDRKALGLSREEQSEILFNCTFLTGPGFIVHNC